MIIDRRQLMYKETKETAGDRISHTDTVCETWGCDSVLSSSRVWLTIPEMFSQPLVSVMLDYLLEQVMISLRHSVYQFFNKQKHGYTYFLKHDAF